MEDQVTQAAPDSAAAQAPEGAGAAASAPAAPQETPESESQLPGASGQDQGQAPGSGAESGTAEAGAEGEQPEAEGAEEATEYTVVLPGLEERGEQPIELEAPDEETYNRLNRLANEAAVGRQVREQEKALQAQRRELTELQDMIQIDPTGFILDQVPENVRVDVAMQLLFQPKVLEAVEQRLAQNEAIRELLGEDAEPGLPSVLGNRLALRALRAELEADRLRMQSKLREQVEYRRTLQANAERIAAEINRLIPETITGERREQLFADAVRDVRDRLQKLQINEIDPHDVRLIVSDRFRRLGIDLEATGNGGSPNGGRAPVRPAAAPQGRTAEQFMQARNARRAAAATAPAGAGAPAVKPRPDLPKGTAERIKLARKVGLRALLGLS